MDEKEFLEILAKKRLEVILLEGTPLDSLDDPVYNTIERIKKDDLIKIGGVYIGPGSFKPNRDDDIYNGDEIIDVPKNKATISISYMFGPTHGEGLVFQYSKENDNWIYENTIKLWIS